MTTATTTVATRVMAWAENARVHDLRLAMWEWRMDPVGGRTRLVKDIARKHGATNHEITRAYLRVSAGLRPNALAFQDLDAYAAAWRDALVKALRAYKATADHCFSVVLDRSRDEARFIRMMKGAKTHHKERAHRAWRRNAERMARKWAQSL
jgi:predicted ATPase